MSSLLILWAIGSDIPVKILAIVGAFTLGALLGGWLCRLIAKLAFGQTMPTWVTWTMRLLSGVLCGLLAYMWLAGVGGGFGGPGGWGFGGNGGSEKDKGGKDKKENGDKTVDPPEKEIKDKKKPDDSKGTGSDPVIRVEILGNDALKKIDPSIKPDSPRRYRVVDNDGKLLTLDEVQNLIRQGRSKTPPLERLEIIIYPKSPDRSTSYVSELEKYAKDIDEPNKRFYVTFIEKS